MDWVTPREDPAEALFTDLHRPSHPHHPDFSPLVNGFLTVANPPTVTGEWPVPHVTRNARNDFRYEFSLSASPEFDTDSADAPPSAPHLHHEDDASTDLHGAATSEDTSIAPLPHKKEKILESDPPNSTSPSKPVKTISKKKATSKKTHRSAALTPTNPSASMSAGTSAPQSGTLSHTKMCRDRLNNMFERLRHTLPPAPSGVEVKHKAQVLDYAIAVLKNIVERTSQLEIELAVSSNKATMDWISKLVNKVDTFADAAEQVMRLFSRRRAWKHAELWVATKRPGKSNTDPEHAIVLTFNRSVPNDVMLSVAASEPSLQLFSKESESYTFRAKEGVQGRVWSSMRPEWVTGLSDLKNFRRAALARKYGLKVCLALPVTITGKIEAVMCFYDTKHRPYDTQCLELGMRLAWALGNAVGGKRAKVNILSTSGASSS